MCIPSMSEESGLISLQKRQYKHDKEHHQDIFNTPYPDRMNHYTLHFSKYVGRISDEYEDFDNLSDHLEKTLADGFIVALAAANTMNIDIYQEIHQTHDIVSKDPGTVAKELNDAHETDNIRNIQQIREWLFEELAVPAGKMANAMESLDHMEPMAVRETLEEETFNICKTILIASDLMDISIESIVEKRWNEIEKESIL